MDHGAPPAASRAHRCGDWPDRIDFYRFVSIGSIMSSPVIDRGVVYVGSMDGNVYAIE
jgi:outer membrane protein assembly factor BamB